MNSIKNIFNNTAVQKTFLTASFFVGAAGVALGTYSQGSGSVISGSIFIAMGAYGLGILKERNNPPRPKP